MPLSVSLLGGKEVDVSALGGAAVRDLRLAVADQLEVNPRLVTLSTASGVLKDDDAVPDGDVTAVLSRLPWLDDGSGRFEDDGGGECHVGGEPQPGDNKFNALCEVGFDCGKDYFEVEVLEGEGAWVGVTTKAGFGPGYKLKALLYGGNLSDGGGLLRGHFGPDGVKTGDVVGVSLDLTDPAVFGVTLWHNDKYLGEAFACPRPEPGTTLYPVVSGRKAGDRFRISLRREVRQPVLGPPPHAAEGAWRLNQLFVGPELGEVNLNEVMGGLGRGGMEVTLLVKKDPSDPMTFQLGMRVANQLNIRIKATPAVEGQAPHPFEAVDPTPVMSTMMMAPPEIMELEATIAKNLEKVGKWLARGDKPEDETLLIQGPTMEMSWARDNDREDQKPVSTVTLP